ncbi:hypothetical protein JX580_08425 [Thiomicrospira microaerophila]|uniref:hypothetical protein n=1 Tax=Thiomicrospira microaerophila TaxID=406020 RepID=UPI00201008BD|nr:hypothetical protein [Thiomicrospira microaerophila]UQB41692.1 hypothetical protein JX580_08425 [Thiomicrospira microaerophila]
MAEANKTIDPNDLDSIDALLDEAEFDFGKEDAETAQEPELKVNEKLIEDNPPETMREDLSEREEDIVIDPALTAEEDLALNDMLGLDDESVQAGSDQLASIPLSGGEPPISRQMQDNTDEIIARRAQQGAHKSDELTVEEMDSIKKMVIGFGSGLSVLVVIAIVMASWAAFGSKGDSGLESLLVEAKEELEITRVAAQANERSLRELNRKLDAVSFQVEQLSADVMSQQQPNNMVLRGAAPIDADIPVSTANNTAAVSSNLEVKIDSLTRNLAVAQRRIVEVNNRVTSVQTQQASVLQAVKSMEKTLLEKQLTMSEGQSKQISSEAVSEEKPSSKSTEYRYQAPPASGLMYQSGHGGIYP